MTKNRLLGGDLMEADANAALAQVLTEISDFLEGKIISAEKTKIGITLAGSEHGPQELMKGIRMAERLYPDIECVPIGEKIIAEKGSLNCDREVHEEMEKMLLDKVIDGAVTMHYNFPIGVATVGRVTAPATGKEMFLATTTGSTSAKRVEALVHNALCGISAAKSCGIELPTVGFLNIDGARQAEKAILQLKEKGYDVDFASSIRTDGGTIMRGNDLLMAACDVMVVDSLTGNILMKILSAFQTGGNYEAVGYGYGPGIGADAENIVCILSRASGAPVVAGAIRYCADVSKGNLLQVYAHELQKAKNAGLEELLSERESLERNTASKMVAARPAEKVVTEEIAGIDILELDDAVQVLWTAGIYGKTGMGCTGPVIMVAAEDQTAAKAVLKKERYI
jgi:glycine/sarcosine/betaine reductase complex component C subunit alpha